VNKKFELAIKHFIDGKYYNGFNYFSEYLNLQLNESKELQLENLKKMSEKKPPNIIEIIKAILEGNNGKSEVAVKITELFWALKPVETTKKLIEDLENNQEKQNYKIAILNFLKKFDVYLIINKEEISIIENKVKISLMEIIKNKSEMVELRKNAICTLTKNPFFVFLNIKNDVIIILLKNICNDVTENTIVRETAEKYFNKYNIKHL